MTLRVLLAARLYRAAQKRLLRAPVPTPAHSSREDHGYERLAVDRGTRDGGISPHILLNIRTDASSNRFGCNPHLATMSTCLSTVRIQSQERRLTPRRSPTSVEHSSATAAAA